MSGQGEPRLISEGQEFTVFAPEDRNFLAEVKAAAVAGLRAAEQRKREDVLARFERRNLDRAAIQAIENSTDTFRAQAGYILANTKPGREQAAALTALEEAKFWTNQSLALNANSIIDREENA